ncbi:DNA mismatch repair endonuclease MutL [Chloroflexota bacterium]
MSIHILPPEVASQIAAGEVVERPASVVKELVENSLDAGANSVTITVEDAGKRIIEVADDGSGILVDQLSLAVERHATNKLEGAEDLHCITSLGFRGEALASIGSVARLTLTSRTADTDLGARMQVEGGHASPVQPLGSTVGTVVRVENLFFNVPARLKFLKHDQTERRAIDKLVTRYSLAYPHVRYSLHQDGRLALQTSGNGNRREILGTIYGVEIARQLIEVISEDDWLQVLGFTSPTSLTRSSRRELAFFVNGRPVKDAALSAAVIKAYHNLLMINRYPITVLFLKMPPEMVDVNVHPTKAEVRFREPARIFSSVQSAVRRALLAHSPVPNLEFQPHWSNGTAWGEPRTIDPTWGWRDIDIQRKEGEAIPEGSFPTPGSQSPSTTKTGLGALRAPLLRPVGQVASTYLVAEGPDGLYLIDQHAAHERVLFERVMKQRDSSIPSQILLQPVAIDLPPDETRLLQDQLDILGKIGFQVELFGHNSFLLRAVPAILENRDPAASLLLLVEDFEEDETPLQAELEARIIARICKRAAIKAGKNLSPEEQRALLTDLEACQSPRTCPHGRPTMIHLSVDLLERQFGRRGSR